MPSRPLYRTAAALLLLLAGGLAGCGPPPDLDPTPDVTLPPAGTPGTPPTTTLPTPPAGGPSSPGADRAVDCAGKPDRSQVLAVLQDAGLLDDDSEVEFSEGPLCAEDWQFTVITTPERDPLHVLTSGPADELTLVTAGTDVCTIEVRVHAPPGIRGAAGCVG